MRALREPGKKKKNIGKVYDGGVKKRGRARSAKENANETRRRGGKRKGKEKKNEKTRTMQLYGHGEKRREGDEWTACSGGVLLAGFRGVEIPYNVRDVCVDSFNPPRPGTTSIAIADSSFSLSLSLGLSVGRSIDT